MISKYNLEKLRTKKIINLIASIFFPIVSLIILILIFVSCATMMYENKATLILNISSPFQAKTLLPDIDMEPAAYDLAGNSPNGGNFSLIDEQTPVMVPLLDPGEWTVTVSAKNVDGTVIARGEQTTTLYPGETQTLNITVSPIEGYGAVDLTVYWSADDTIVPSIEAQLIPHAGPPIDLDFIIQEEVAGTETGTCTSTEIPTGYYTLVIQLLDNGLLTMGAVEVIRVVKDYTTSGVFEFYDINQTEGDIAINITPEMNNPIEMTMSGQVESIGIGGAMTVEASVPPDTGNVVYVWYINGESKATGSNYTTRMDLPVGIYRLDVVAFTSDGKRAGSATHTFRILAVELVELTLTWDPNTEPDLAGYILYWGFSSSDYVFSVDVGNQTSYTVTDLAPGATYYFAVTAYNTSGLESDYSNEVVYTVPFA